MDPFVRESVDRFEAVVREDCDVIEIEDRVFEIVDDMRRASVRPGQLEAVATHLERMAGRLEAPPFHTPEMADQGAPLRSAGVLRRAADLLRGPEDDLTPKGLSGGKATPKP